MSLNNESFSGSTPFELGHWTPHVVRIKLLCKVMLNCVPYFFKLQEIKKCFGALVDGGGAHDNINIQFNCLGLGDFGLPIGFHQIKSK